MMFAWRRALALCVLFSCAAGDAPRGVCVDNTCWALFLESKDFAEAQGSCRDSGGQLHDVNLWGAPPLTLLRGLYWVQNTHGSWQCWSVTQAAEQVLFQNSTCTDRLDGAICQYFFTSTCGALRVSGGAHVNYTTVWGFEVKTVFPTGTVAVARAPGRPPDSKHVCMGTQWLRAPWSCEVMGGGCEHACTASTGTCSCPTGQILHLNNITCTDDPCVKCTPHQCVKEEDTWECRCSEGFRLEAGGHCVDVDECSEDRTLCSGPGEECQNLEGSYECGCQEDYDLVGGVCVDVSVCFECEHVCEPVQGVMRCVCRSGFRVDPQDPTKCEQYCSEQDCPADCPAEDQCYCPIGYIQDLSDEGTICTDIDECEVEAQCDHHCINTFGGFRCECEEGFQLGDKHQCVPIETSPILSLVHPTVSRTHPTAFPPYVKTGSILGITTFAVLCIALLYFLFHTLSRNCYKGYSLKHDMDIFTLQQVSTETYKRLSYDWQFRNDSHRL